jgi:predicted dehydrogenase
MLADIRPISTGSIVGSRAHPAQAKVRPLDQPIGRLCARPASGAFPAMIGLAVIGMGAIGRVHARHLAHHVPGAELVLVVDKVAELAAEAGDELGVRWSTRPEDALREPGVSAIVVAVPTPFHPGLIEQAAAAGVHVFCEKPLGLELAGAQRAVRAARSAGVRLQVGFQRRFDPDFLAAKRHIDSGAVGAVQLLRIAHRNRTPPHETELVERLGSIFVDMTVHDFDTARWLVGEVDEVTAFERKRNAVSVLRFKNGALGIVDNSRYAGYGFECSAEVVGSDSTLRVGGRGRPLDVDVLTACGALSRVAEDHIERHRTAYRDELRHFVACLRDGSEPSVGGEDAIAALRLALSAERCVA